MILYSYFRSSAAYRVRIALNIKDIKYSIKPIHLLRSGGEQHHPEFHKINPQNLVPVLTHNNRNISQSLAIMEYLETYQPTPSLFPENTSNKTASQEFSLMICCDIHPLNNLRVLNYLKHGKASEIDVTQWVQHWINEGFSALETKISSTKSNDEGRYCFGDTATIADCCLIPQIYNALRYDVDMSKYPMLNKVYQHCLEQPDFHQAAPEQQTDYPD